MNDVPLVSVCVTTYHSSEFVIETLDSIYRQSYPNIELIVSDDGSTDDTVEKVQQWLSESGHKFTKTFLLTVGENTGLTANYTRALRQASGEWVKTIAGDDFLYPDAIESFVSFVQERKAEDIALVVSSIRIFNEHPDNLLYIWPDFKISESIRQQLKRQIIGDYIKAPGVIFKREIFEKLGGFDPNYPMLEDDPLWIRFLTNGYKFYFHNEVLVGYRIHPNSISNGSDIPKKNFFPSLYGFMKEVAFPLMIKNRLYVSYIAQRMEYNVYHKVIYSGKERKRDKLQLKIAYSIKNIINRLNKWRS